MKPVETILIVGKDPFLNSLIQASVKTNVDWKNSTFEIIGSVEKAKSMLSVQNFIITLVDCHSYIESPLEILIQLRASNNRTPLILLNQPGNEKTAVNCLKHGADYYLIRESQWETELVHVIETV